MKEFIKKVWEWIASKVCSIPFNELLYFTIGLLVASVFAILWPGGIGEACLFPVGVVVVFKFFLDIWLAKSINWEGYVSALIGGTLIQILVLI